MPTQYKTCAAKGCDNKFVPLNSLHIYCSIKCRRKEEKRRYREKAENREWELARQRQNYKKSKGLFSEKEEVLLHRWEGANVELKGVLIMKNGVLFGSSTARKWWRKQLKKAPKGIENIIIEGAG